MHRFSKCLLAFCAFASVGFLSAAPKAQPISFNALTQVPGRGYVYRTDSDGDGKLDLSSGRHATEVPHRRPPRQWRRNVPDLLAGTPQDRARFRYSRSI